MFQIILKFPCPVTGNDAYSGGRIYTHESEVKLAKERLNSVHIENNLDDFETLIVPVTSMTDYPLGLIDCEQLERLKKQLQNQ